MNRHPLKVVAGCLAATVLWGGSTAMAATIHTLSCTRSGVLTSIQVSDESPRTTSDTGLRQYGENCQAVIDAHWQRFGMQSQYWGGGLGYFDACNILRPFNRTLRTLEELKVSGIPTTAGLRAWALAIWTPPTNEFVYLQRAYDNLDYAVDSLRGGCANANSEDPAATFEHSSEADEASRTYWIDLWLPNYQDNVVAQGARLVHHAQHRWVAHDGGHRCAAGRSCDSSWDIQGADAHEVYWLWSYSRTAAQTQPYLRQYALDIAKSYAATRFVTPPRINWPASIPSLPSGW